MKIFGIVLIALGGIGIILGGMMFGDIGLAAWVGAVPAIVSGVGFLKLDKILSERR